MSRFAFVIEEGFEPSTHSLEGCCSIQLSYPTGHFSETLSSKKRRKGKRLYCKHQIGNRFFADAETPAHLATKRFSAKSSLKKERKNPFSLNDTTNKRIIGIHKTPDIRSLNVGDSEKSTYLCRAFLSIPCDGKLRS